MKTIWAIVRFEVAYNHRPDPAAYLADFVELEGDGAESEILYIFDTKEAATERLSEYESYLYQEGRLWVVRCYAVCEYQMKAFSGYWKTGNTIFAKESDMKERDLSWS